MADLPLLIAAIRLDTGNMNRDAVIQYLILDRLDKIHRCNHATWLARLLEGGFVGFANMTDQQLVQECVARGIECDLHASHVDPEADADDDATEDLEHFIPSHGHRGSNSVDHSS